MTDRDAASPKVAETDAIEIAGDSMTFAGWTLVSRITGFLRVAVIASILGPTFFGNLYQATYVLSSTVHELLIGSMIPVLLVPPLVRHVTGADSKSSSRLAGGLLGVTLLVFTAAAVAVALAGPIILRALTLGVADEAAASSQRSRGWPLLAVMAPQVVLYGIAATGVAIQHAHKRFALAAAAPSFENLGVIAVLVGSAIIFGTGFELEQVSDAHLMFLGVGTTLAVALHAGAQWWGARRLGVSLRPRAGWRDDEVREILRLSVPSLGISALTAAQYFAVLIVAGSVAGGVIAFQIGWLLVLTVVSLSAKPVATAQLPRLANWFNQGGLTEFKREYRQGLALGLFVALPASLLTLGASGVLASVVSFGEMATPAGLTLVTAAIGALAVGIAGRSTFQIATSASFARRDANSPLAATAVRLIVSLPIMAAALIWAEGSAVILTLGIAVTIGELLSGYHVHRRVLASLGGAEKGWGTETLGDLIAAIAASIPAVVLALGISSVTSPRAGEVVALVAAGVAMAGAYFVFQHRRRSQALASIVAAVRGSADRRTARPGDGPAGHRGKRVVDLLVSVLLLLLTLPAMAAIALVIRLTSRGPVIFKQRRIGLNGSQFTTYKFRTMRHGSDDTLHRRYSAHLLLNQSAEAMTTDGIYKLEGDPRITRVGRFLRRFSLDELPQLINVLRGEMSVVGPRPALPYEVELYQPSHRRRLQAKPGLTGLWQVSGRSRLSMHDMLDLDVAYVDKWSPALDVSILVRTLPAVVRKDGAR